jgi:hypothetical protein
MAFCVADQEIDDSMLRQSGQAAFEILIAEAAHHLQLSRIRLEGLVDLTIV